MDTHHHHSNFIDSFLHQVYYACKFLFDQREELIEYETHNLIKLEPEQVKWNISMQIKRILAFSITIAILITVLIRSINKHGTLK
jgi:hypothetical protein